VAPGLDADGMTARASALVSVDPDGRGAWEVVLPDTDDHIVCATLDDARQMAYRTAARRRPCELIVHDAYHRVIQSAIVDAAQAGRPAEATFRQ
jgi:hypothetical protein